MTINEIAKENYKHAVRRGKIDDNTTFFDFHLALKGEVNELFQSGIRDKLFNLSIGCNFDPSEAVDVILVTMSLLEHNGYDVEKEIMKKLKINQER